MTVNREDATPQTIEKNTNQFIVYGKIKDISPYKYQGSLDDDNCSTQAIAGIEEDIENDTKITLN